MSITSKQLIVVTLLIIGVGMIAILNELLYEGTLPHYIGGFIVAEILFFLRDRRSLFLEVAVGLIIFLSLMLISYDDKYSEFGEIVTISAIVAMPIVLFMIANQFLIRLKTIFLKHLALLLLTLVVMTLWIFWALINLCAGFGDCL